VSIINNFKDGPLAYIQPESIAWCINHLLKNPDEMRRISEAGHNRINLEFDWKMIAERTESIYKEIKKSNSFH
jgi:glycosyltransferase involved in cell wall biosynthesis